MVHMWSKFRIAFLPHVPGHGRRGLGCLDVEYAGDKEEEGQARRPPATIVTPAHLDRATFLPPRACAVTVPSVSSRPDISILATDASTQSGIQEVE